MAQLFCKAPSRGRCFAVPRQLASRRQCAGLPSSFISQFERLQHSIRHRVHRAQVGRSERASSRFLLIIHVGRRGGFQIVTFCRFAFNLCSLPSTAKEIHRASEAQDAAPHAAAGACRSRVRITSCRSAGNRLWHRVDEGLVAQARHPVRHSA